MRSKVRLRLARPVLFSRFFNLNGRQSRQTNVSASIVKRAKERFRNSEMLEEAQQGERV